MKKPKLGAELTQADPKPTKSQMNFETQDHMRKLTDAFEVMADPEKMKRVKALAGRHHKAIKSLSDLKNVRDQFAQANDDDNDGDEGGM